MLAVAFRIFIMHTPKFAFKIFSHMHVMDVKIQLEQIQGDTFPSGRQKIIYKGNVLKDDTTMDDNGVIENSHLHVMLHKAVESENTIAACHFDSTKVSHAIMEDCSRISELRSIRGSSAFLRITEVFLIDEAAIDRLDLSSTFSQKQVLHKNAAVEDDAEGNHFKVDPFYEEHTDLLGGMDLINEMVALGLPSSFCTSSKEKHTSIKRKNKKSVKKGESKLAQVTEERDLPLVEAEVSNDEVNNEAAVHLNSHFASVELYGKDEDISNQILVNGTNGTCSSSCQNGSTLFNGSIISNNNVMTSMQTDSLYNAKNSSLSDHKAEIDISVDMMCEEEIGARKAQKCNGGLDDRSELHLACCVQEITSLYNVDPNSDIEIDVSRVSCPPHVVEVSQLEKASLQNNVPTEEAQHCAKSNWEPVWDSYYQRYYYYNYETLETSWDPPGLEHSTDIPSISYTTDNCVAGNQAICEASSGSYDECSQSDLKDNEDNIEATLGCQIYSQVYQELADDILNKVKVEAGKVHYMKDNIAYECLIGKDNFNTEKLPTHNPSDNRQYGNIVLEQTDISLATTSPEKDIETISTKATVQGLERTSDCFLSKGLGFSTHLLSSLNTIESLHALPQACGTHIWFDDEGNIERKCSLQHEATHVHAHESDTYIDAIAEATYEDTSISETFSSGNGDPPKEQKKKKRTRLRRLSSIDKDGEPSKKLLLPGRVEEMSTTIIKYWCQRYQLFSRFDEGIQLDEEGWFSVTPEVIAKHHAARCGTDTIIDCFTGVGGNAIQFAQKSHHVVAIDIDPKKIDYACHNARLYGVADYIDFIVGDFFQLAPFLKANVVFLSPPWGGPDYLNVESYDIQDMLRPKDGFSLFKAAQMIAQNIVMFLPRNVDLNQLAELSLHSSPPLPLQIEKNYVNGRLKAITAYFGDISLPIIV
ncbi:uncharacterized protein LOC131028011 isoform X1 [Cryptomeria japonica]|uniref:uncharacterized protein LOC131028011 isoform X1 n=3 Tax=Cryptomeria japonica TaxID=3369 RepID=UPI0027D9F063|nr:uncharacterized protein LOC131028011 isoform X1 [Cryptomeria japonica]XP_057814108.2 uncharacterized protein LOC131028011 isoform X1 [Cryptomeria japonica]